MRIGDFQEVKPIASTIGQRKKILASGGISFNDARIGWLVLINNNALDNNLEEQNERP